MASINDIDTQEATNLFAVRRQCLDIEEWIPQKSQPNTWVASGGVLNMDETSANLLVELFFRKSQKTGTAWYKFTVFKRNLWGLERAYQLDIEQFTKKITPHDLPHEHFGKDRISGERDWANWSFTESLQHFSRRTKINFLPDVEDPHKSFSLKVQ
ncbi:hypothetical protein [Comamonas odontotermitis]|uniref:hypothetical protein n=1 Tax=Comamonas TaxID=283 RepID=UPI003752D46F